MQFHFLRNACVAAAIALTGAAHGATLVTNGSFEDGLNGWSTSGSVGLTTGPTKDGALAGLIGFAMPDIYSGTLSQTISTIAGHQYQLSFWLETLPSGAPFDLSANLGSSAISFNVNTVPVNTYKQYFISSVADSGTLDIAFNGKAITGRTFIDAVTVTDQGVAPSVPEASSLSLLVAGSAVLGLLSRRRKLAGSKISG